MSSSSSESNLSLLAVLSILMHSFDTMLLGTSTLRTVNLLGELTSLSLCNSPLSYLEWAAITDYHRLVT